MIRRALVVGFIGGILLSIAGLYPVVSLLAPLVSPMWHRPVPNELVHGLLLMGSAAIGFPVLFTLGLFAAHRGEARGWLPGMKAGLIAGLVASLVVYTTLVSPINALFAYGTIVDFLTKMSEAHVLPAPVLARYVTIFENGNYLIEITFALGLLIAGSQGAWMGWRRRNEPEPERPSLYAHIASGKHPRRWVSSGEEASSKAGLIVGFLGSVVAMFAAFSWFYVGFIEEWPELANAMQHSHVGIVVGGPLRQAGSVLSPFIMLGSLFYGAAVVWMIKDPPNLIRARVRGVLLASSLIFGSAFAIGLRVFYFNFGLLPFWLARSVQQDPTLMTDAADSFQGMMQLVQQPWALIALVLATPWVFLVLAMITAVAVGLLQGLIYGFLIPLAHPRPVDKAARWWGRWWREPQDVLRHTYALFNEEKSAYQILPHLAVAAYRRMPGASRLAAAYYSLGTAAQESEQAALVGSIQEILAAEPEWRWSADFQAVFAALSQILAARSLDDIVQIASPIEQHTTSLPPSLVQSVHKIGRVIEELHKVTMVDDLATKLIFLENALAAIHEGQRFVAQQMQAVDTAVSPEFMAISTTLDHWQGIVLAAIKRLKGRAAVSAELQTRQSPVAAQIPLIYCVANDGLNVAQQVRVKVLPGEDYHLGDDSEAWIEILPPGEQRQVNLTVLPQDGRRRLRVAWQVTYDDAVDAERSLTFADMVEFAEPDKPFQRIFPIPYVTGTPLKTDDVFVGREDVFAFIRENLLGAHQNNVIVLHGQRRTGKTSVLYRLGQVMAETHIAVLVDMQGKPARGEADFLFSVADDIAFALEDCGLDVEPPRREDFAEGPEFFFSSRFLRGLHPLLGDKNLLLLFDEFEELQRRVEDGRLQPEIFQFLRNLMQHEDRVDFVFSGTHKLEELGAEYWSILFNIASYKPITFLSAADMHRLIAEPVAAFNLEYDPLAADRIIKVTAGHPYFAQLVLHEMVVYHNETQRSYLTVMDVDRCLERIVGRGEAHFKFIWAESPPEARTVLQAMAELLVSQEAVNVKDVRDFLAAHGYDSVDDWQHALADLEGRDILTRQSAKSPLYRFKVDLIRLWIDRTRPSL